MPLYTIAMYRNLPSGTRSRMLQPLEIEGIGESECNSADVELVAAIVADEFPGWEMKGYWESEEPEIKVGMEMPLQPKPVEECCQDNMVTYSTYPRSDMTSRNLEAKTAFGVYTCPVDQWKCQLAKGYHWTGGGAHVFHLWTDCIHAKEDIESIQAECGFPQSKHGGPLDITLLDGSSKEYEFHYVWGCFSDCD